MKYIVIPTCNTTDKCLPYLDNLLTSIVDGGYFENDYTVIICYDNCNEEFQKYFQEKYRGHRIAAINNRNPKNLNFCANVRTGMAFAMSHEDLKHLIILNQDTVLPNTFMFDQVLGEGLSFPTPVDSIEEVAQEVLRSDVPKRTPVLRYSGFCMCMSKALLDKVGGLDTRFIAGMDDDDLCVRSVLAGFPVEVVDVKVHHELKDRSETNVSSTGAYNLHDLGVRLQIFRRKWSIPQISHEEFAQWIIDNHRWHEEMKCL